MEATAKNKKKTLSREEATELYRDLASNMKKLKEKKAAASSAGKEKYPPGLAAQIAAALMGREVLPEAKLKAQRTAATDSIPNPITGMQMPQDTVSLSPAYTQRRMHAVRRGQVAALVFVFAFATLKVVLAVMEASGVASVSPAEASFVNMPRQNAQMMGSHSGADAISFSKEEVRILTALDTRRAELEERAKRLDERDADVSKRDKEFVIKLAQLRELSDKVKGDREKDEKKRNVQLDQLANVYGSMAPQEAATLMEQLDVTIALSLIERMPEKRIGQILAMMNPEKALGLTRMLSGRGSDK